MTTNTYKIPTIGELNNIILYNRLVITVQHEEEESINIIVSEPAPGILLVMKILPGSLLEDVIKPGDFILKVGRNNVDNIDRFYNLALNSHPQLSLEIARRKTQKSSLSQTNSSKQKHVPTDSHFPDEARLILEFHGDYIKPENEYLLIEFKTSKSDKRLGIIVKAAPTDKTSIIISKIPPYTIASDVFKLGDRILYVNQRQITDAETCRQLIIDSKGNFDILIERPPLGLITHGLVPSPSSNVASFRSSYTVPDEKDPVEEQGDPLIDYEMAPGDIQTILKRIPEVDKAFRAPVKPRTVKKSAAASRKKELEIETDVSLQPIQSDVAPDQYLRKCPKRN